MSATVFQQVSEWLTQRGREDWIAAEGTGRLELCEQWRDVSLRYGDESPPALGCLLALAQCAWGCDEWRRLTIEVAGAGWCVIVRNGRHRPSGRARPGWDLDHVAHPRYLNSVGPLGANEFATYGLALAAALLAAPPPQEATP